MSRFDGISCPVCANIFADGDDIVVCPDCGTPHHRKCYTNNVKCINESLHISGFIWKCPVEKAIYNDRLKEDSEISEISVSADGDSIEYKSNENTGNSVFSDFPGFRDFIENNEINRRKYEKRHEQFDKYDILGVSEREIRCFQSSTNPYLIDKYRRLATGRKFSFNLFTLLLFPYIAFYSRMRAIGILVTALNFILRVPYTLLVISYDLNFMNLTSMSEVIETNQETLIQLNSLLGFIQLIFRLFAVLLYDYIYLRWMVRKIKTIRMEFPHGFEKAGNDYSSALRAAGRPSFIRMILDSLGVVCALLTIMFIALYVLNM